MAEPRVMRSASGVLGTAILLGIAGTAAYYTYAYATALELYEGDEVEIRTCRRCKGTTFLSKSRRSPPIRCPYCEGSGEVQVIVPGHNRPTRIWGAVVDATAVENVGAYRPKSVRGAMVHEAFLPASLNEYLKIDGAIADAKVTFRLKSGEEKVVRTNSTGRFSVKLKRGRYRIEIEAAGFKLYTPKKKLVVQPMRSVIWQESKPPMDDVDELETMRISFEESRARSGLNFVAGIEPRRERARSFYKVYAADQ